MGFGTRLKKARPGYIKGQVNLLLEGKQILNAEKCWQNRKFEAQTGRNRGDLRSLRVCTRDIDRSKTGLTNSWAD